MRVLVNKNNDKQPIHSGHFMVSNFEDETQEEDEVLIPNDPEEALRTESVITFVPQVKRPRLETSKSDYEITKVEDTKEAVPKYSEQQYLNSDSDALLESRPKQRFQALVQCECEPVRTSSGSLIHALNLCSGLEIDQSLAKLFQCMSIAYRQKLTSPKWNLFKGMKLSWKDKIRLNNVIWRCWHMQFIFKHPGTIVQFASPLDVDNHCKPEAIVLEGKYWKRRLATVTAEYKKWRIFYKNKIMGRHLSGSDQNLARDLDIPGSSSSVCSRDTSARSIDFFDDEFLAEFSDTLFTSLANNQPYPFPNAREIAKNASIADFIQPGLIQLQPYLDEFNEIEPLDAFGLMNSRFNMAHDNVSAISVLPSLNATSSRSLETPAHFHSVETPVDSFSAELSPAESQPVDPLETLISSSKTYQRAVEEPYQVTVLEGRSRCNSIGKRSYSEFSGSGGMLIVSSPSPVAASEPPLVRSDSSREFAVPLLRQRSRSRSGSSKPPDFQRAASSSSLKFSELENPPSQQPTTVQGFVPFSKSSNQKQYQRRDESHPFVSQMNQHEPHPLQKMHTEMHSSQEEWHSQTINLIKGTSIQNQHPAHSIATPHLTTISPTQISQGHMRIHQSPPEDCKESTVLDLLTLGTGLQLQAQPSQKPQPSHRRHPSAHGRPAISPSKVPEVAVLSCARTPVGFNDFRNLDAGTQPMDVDVGPSVRRGRPIEDSKTKIAELTKQNAPCVDAKKRGTMKSGFDILHTLIPGIGNQPPNGKNSETSKAAMLHKGAQYITQLRMEREKQLKEIERLKREQKELTSAISHCQSVLPATGAPVSRTNSVARVKGTFDAWVRARTRQNWKFWIFSRLVKPLLESFFNAVDSSSPNEFWCSVFSWIEQYCSLVNLRPAALNTLRELSTKTDILTNPGSMPAYAYSAVQSRSHPEE